MRSGTVHLIIRLDAGTLARLEVRRGGHLRRRVNTFEAGAVSVVLRDQLGLRLAQATLLRNLRARVVISLLQIVRNSIVLAQVRLEVLSELPILLRLIRETAVSDLHVGVATTAVLGVHNWLRVNVRVLRCLELFGVRQVRQVHRGGVELVARLLHVIETSSVVVDVGVSAGAVRLIDDTTVTHHILAVVITRSRNCRCKSPVRLILRAC